MRKYRFKCVYDDGTHDFKELEEDTLDEVFRTAFFIMITKKAFQTNIDHIDVYDGEKDKKLFTVYK